MKSELNPEGLLALAERCEQATGPDSELDLAILLAKTPDRLAFMDADFARMRMACEKNGLWPKREERCRREAYSSPYQYTRSIDAVLTLVPEGYWHGFQTETTGFNAHCFEQVLDAPLSMGLAATPALALCAAALRATASMQTGDRSTQPPVSKHALDQRSNHANG